MPLTSLVNLIDPLRRAPTIRLCIELFSRLFPAGQIAASLSRSNLARFFRRRRFNRSASIARSRKRSSISFPPTSAHRSMHPRSSSTTSPSAQHCRVTSSLLPTTRRPIPPHSPSPVFRMAGCPTEITRRFSTASASPIPPARRWPAIRISISPFMMAISPATTRSTPPTSRRWRAITAGPMRPTRKAISTTTAR